MSGIVGGNLGRGSGLIKAGAIDDDSVTLAKMAGLARGKLIYGDASGDPAALAAGGTDEVLTHDGTDFDWAAAGGGGKILQVVGETSSTATSTTSNTGVQKPNPSPTITPSSSSSKILIIGSTMATVPANYLEWTLGRVITDGATTIDLSGTADGMGRITSTGENSLAVNWLDSPSTTSAVTYYFYFKNDDSSTSMTLGVATSTKDHLTLIEIDGT